jgi:hypothetical protein
MSDDTWNPKAGGHPKAAIAKPGLFSNANGKPSGQTTAQCHAAAADHHESAAKLHLEAAQLYASGSVEKAIRSCMSACEHGEKAMHHADKARKQQAGIAPPT